MPPSGSKCKQNTACSMLGLFNPEDGGIMFHQNIGKLLPVYMASHPRRLLIIVTAMKVSNAFAIGDLI